jgi:superfamily II DNA or RNA helicase
MKKTIISLYESVIKQSKISDRPYQREFLTDLIYLTPNKPIVLGAGTSSGKTVIAILKLILFYLIPSNKTKKSLVIPAFQEILRDNFMEQLREIESNYGKLPFTYIEIKGKNSDEQIKRAIKNGINVIICLPVTINNNSSLLRNKIEWLYFDEAQYFYLQKMCRNLVSVIKPKYQMLMTGSVAKYNARREDFIIKYVPVSELFKLGYISNPKVELIQSSYNFKDADYVSLWGNLRDTKTNDANQNTKALLSVAKGMLLTLRNPFMNVTTNSNPIKKMLRVFGEIDKTIMICNSIPQAKCFYSILNEELKGNVMISHSKTEKEDWDNFEKFKTNDTKLIRVELDSL